MVKKSGSRRRTSVVAGALGLVLVGGAAFAYWTWGGGGNGTVTAKSTLTDLVVTQTASIGALAPGESVPLSGTISNPNNTDAKVGTITATITGVSDGELADFSIGGNGVAVDTVVKKGTPVAWSGMTLTYANSDVNQDNGKGATVSISYALTPFVEPPSTGTMTFVNQILTVKDVAIWPTANGDVAIQPTDKLAYNSRTWTGTYICITIPASVVTDGVLSYTSAPYGYYNHGPLMLKHANNLCEARVPEWNPLP